MTVYRKTYLSAGIADDEHVVRVVSFKSCIWDGTGRPRAHFGDALGLAHCPSAGPGWAGLGTGGRTCTVEGSEHVLRQGVAWRGVARWGDRCSSLGGPVPSFPYRQREAARRRAGDKICTPIYLDKRWHRLALPLLRD